MTRLETSISSLLGLVFLLGTVLAAQDQTVALAVVGFDGRLVPFAVYSGTTWERAWPEPQEEMKAPPTTSDVPSFWRRRGEPVPSVWRVWPSSGSQPTQAHVTGVEVVDAYCQGQVALTTDLPTKKDEHAFKLGLAVNSNLPINSIDKLSRSDVLWDSAERSIAATFSRLEATKTQGDSKPLARETPEPAVNIAALYREANTGRSPLYFVAEKKYRTSRFAQDAECFAQTIMTGWLVPAKNGNLILRDPKIFVTDCDAQEVRTALPLGAFRVSGKLFWVLEEHGYEDVTYVMAEVGPAEVRYPLTVNSGGC